MNTISNNEIYELLLKMNTKIESIDKRLIAVEEKVEENTQRLIALEEKVEENTRRIIALEAEVSNLKNRVKKLEIKITRLDSELAKQLGVVIRDTADGFYSIINLHLKSQDKRIDDLEHSQLDDLEEAI